MYDMLKVQVKRKRKKKRERQRERMHYTGGVTAHGILSTSLKALNLLIYPPVTGADQARLLLTARKERIEYDDKEVIYKRMHMPFLTFHLSTPSVPRPFCVAAHGETVSLGQSPGEWLGLRGDVVGPGPP